MGKIGIDSSETIKVPTYSVPNGDPCFEGKEQGPVGACRGLGSSHPGRRVSWAGGPEKRGRRESGARAVGPSGEGGVR